MDCPKITPSSSWKISRMPSIEKSRSQKQNRDRRLRRQDETKAQLNHHGRC